VDAIRFCLEHHAPHVLAALAWSRITSVDRVQGELVRLRRLRQTNGLQDPRVTLVHEVGLWRAQGQPGDGRLERIAALAILAREEECAAPAASKAEGGGDAGT
jgi:hypothetical protein